jgi:DUF4097 and DUF4098 domain-containing protein YvlB
MSRFPVIALLLITAGCSVEAADKKLDRTFTVSPGGTLTVDADGASVHVSGHDGNEVVVHMVFEGSEDDLDNLKLDAVQNSNDVTVTMRKAKRGWFSWGIWGNEQEIEVKVPRRYGVSVRTGGGSIDLRDTDGTASLHTSGGSISAKNVIGNIELKTSGGSILADTIRGDVDADTSGGGVRLLNIDGKIRGNTSGGGVRCSLVGANRGISATTAGGGIEIILPRSTAANIDASTSGGSVDADFPVTSTVRKDSRLVGSMNGGGEPIYAHTSGGGVSLRVSN